MGIIGIRENGKIDFMRTIFDIPGFDFALPGTRRNTIGFSFQKQFKEKIFLTMSYLNQTKIKRNTAKGDYFELKIQYRFKNKKK